MARPSLTLIKAIRQTIKNLEEGNHYEWGHMGACNCGNLAQVLTRLSKGQIHEYAMKGHGDWADQVNSYCPTSRLPMDLLISEMIAAGLSLEDLINLERLRDKEILVNIPMEKRDGLRHNDLSDLVTYLRAWVQVLENKLSGNSIAENSVAANNFEIHLTT